MASSERVLSRQRDVTAYARAHEHQLSEAGTLRTRAAGVWVHPRRLPTTCWLPDTPHGLKPHGCSGAPSRVLRLPGRRLARRGGAAPAEQWTWTPAPGARGASNPSASRGAPRVHRRSCVSPRERCSADPTTTRWLARGTGSAHPCAPQRAEPAREQDAWRTPPPA